MSVHSLKIKNYKTIVDSEIIFKGNISGIYGPNGTGKTAVLEVLNIIKEYFTLPFLVKNEINSKQSEDIINNIKKTIKDGISNPNNPLVIELILSIKGTLYKLELEIKVTESSISVIKEALSSKEEGTRKKFKEIFRISNNEDELLPVIYLNSKVNDFSDIIDTQTRKMIIVNFNNFLSYMSLLLNFLLTSSNTLIKNDLNIFYDEFKKVIDILTNTVIITLKEQALYNLQIIIPMNVYLNKFKRGVIPIPFGDTSNIFPVKVAEIIEKVIQQISGIFNTVIPGAKLTLERKIINSNDEQNKEAINIYVERNNKKTLLKQESTGIIKIVSLLSLLTHYVKDEDCIIAIDELDVHIFEYLLAKILEKLALHAKGQLIFTAHNLLPMEKLNKDSIIISTFDNNNVIYTYLKGASESSNLRKKYLKSQSMWSEDNIQPLLINESALELYLQKLVRE